MDGKQDRDQQDTKSVRVKSPLSQISFDSLRAAKPTATSKTTTSRLAMVNRMRLIARSPEDWNQQSSAMVSEFRHDRYWRSARL